MMPLKRFLPWLLLAIITGACASSAPAQRPEPPLPPVLFKSPLKLLLEHYAELGLTTDQMIQVGQADSALQEKNKPLRMRLEELRPRMMGPGRPPPTGGSSMDNPPPGVSPRAWGGGRRRSGFGGMGAPQPEEVPPETEEARQQRMRHIEALLQEMENNETAAIAEAEKALDDKQKTRARELFAQHREERQRAREALRAPPIPPPPAQ
jgi:small-conductance mechanosensitive channel